MLRFGDEECDFEIDVNPVEIINQLTNDCLQSVYNQLMSGNINNEILKIFNDVFKDGTKFNAFFNDGWVDPEGTDIAEANPRNIVKVGQDLISIDVDLNFDDALLVNYSREYIAFTFIHEMLHAYYFGKPELFPSEAQFGDQAEWFQHSSMLSEYLNEMASYISEVFGANEREMLILSLSSLLDIGENDMLYEHLKRINKITDADIYPIKAKYLNDGTRCN